MTPAASDHRDQIATGAWANWLWLLDLPTWERALCLTPPNETVTAIQRYFPSVARTVAEATGELEEWAPATFDLVVADDLTDHLAKARPAVARKVLEECHRIVRPGGCVMLTARNPLWYRRMQPGTALGGAWGSRSPNHLLRRVGFRKIRRYYLAPSHRKPETIIPVESSAIAQYETMEIRMSTRGALRGRLSRVGLHVFLYPSILYLAYR